MRNSCKRPFHAFDGLLPGGLVDNQFADQRIVIRRYRVAMVCMRIETHAQAAGRKPAGDRARIGPEAFPDPRR